MKCCSNTGGCPICKIGNAVPGSHKCGDYTYSTAETSTPPAPEEYDVSQLKVTIPLSLLIEIYAMSKTLAESSIERQILKILKGI